MVAKRNDSLDAIGILMFLCGSNLTVSDILILFIYYFEF